MANKNEVGCEKVRVKVTRSHSQGWELTSRFIQPQEARDCQVPECQRRPCLSLRAPALSHAVGHPALVKKTSWFLKRNRGQHCVGGIPLGLTAGGFPASEGLANCCYRDRTTWNQTWKWCRAEYATNQVSRKGQKEDCAKPNTRALIHDASLSWPLYAQKTWAYTLRARPNHPAEELRGM